MHQRVLRLMTVCWIAAGILGLNDPKPSAMLVVVFHREGLVTPEFNAPEIENTKLMRDLGINKLTPHGKRQLHDLGLIIRKEYPELLEKTHKEKDTFVASLRGDKYVSAVYSFMSGMTINSDEVRIDKFDSRVKPPYHEPLNDIINQITYNTSLPDGIEFRSIHRYSTRGLVKDFDMIDATNPKECKNLSHYTGYQNSDFDFLQFVSARTSIIQEILADYPIQVLYNHEAAFNKRRSMAIIEYVRLGKILGIYQTTKEADDYLAGVVKAGITLAFKDNKAFKLAASQSLRQAADMIKNRSEGITETKIAALSMSASVMTAIFQALGLVDLDCARQTFNKMKVGDTFTKLKDCGDFPDFSSNLVLELVKEDSSQGHFVNCRLNGVYVNVCKDRAANESPYSCPLTAFLELVDKETEADWQTYCESKKERKEDMFEKEMLTVIILLTVFFVLTLVSISCVLKIYINDEKPKDDLKTAIPEFASFDNVKSHDTYEPSSDELGRRLNVKLS